MSSADDHPAKDAFQSDPGTYATRDMLRALAHPLRMQLLQRLGGRGAARAADLAADLGIPANSVSYHLRILAKGGAIVEAPDAARDKRDRVWKLTRLSYDTARPGNQLQDGTVVDTDYVAASAALSMATFEWLREGFTAEMTREVEMLDAGATESSEESEEPFARVLNSSMLHVSPAQARELTEVVQGAIHKWVQLNRGEDGAVLPDDPDSEEPAVDYRVLFAMVRDRPQPADGQDS